VGKTPTRMIKRELYQGRGEKNREGKGQERVCGGVTERKGSETLKGEGSGSNGKVFLARGFGTRGGRE